MEEIWGAVIGSLGFTTLIIMPFIVSRIIKYKLEIAKINAETTIKAEEIRSRNQLEIEKYIRQEDNKQFRDERPVSRVNNIYEEEPDENTNKNKIRL